MTRTTLASANRAAATADHVSTVEMVSIAFPSGTLRLATGDVPVTWGGNTFAASGQLLETGAAEEAGDLTPRTVTLQLAGTDPALISTLRTDSAQYASANVYLGFINAAGALVADPHLLAADMLVSSPQISLGEGTATISLEIETDDIYLGRSSAVLATDVVQRSRSPGDTGMSKVAAIADKTIEWGKETRAVGIRFDRFGRSGGSGGE